MWRGSGDVPLSSGGGVSEGSVPLHREKCLIFQVKKHAGFYVFLLRKTSCGQKPGPREGLIRPLLSGGEAEDVKRAGVENLARGLNSPNPLSS